MAQYTVTEAVEVTGVPYVVLKKHVQRKILRTVKDANGRTMVEQEDIDAYMAVRALGQVADDVKGEPLEVVVRDVGNTIGRLPQHIRDAIIDGMPQTGGKHPGGPEPFRKATAGILDQVVDPNPDDPHHGYPVGYVHESSPQWSRASTSTWVLGDARYSWNGYDWEPSGSARPIEADISPASPFAEMRPIVASRPVSTNAKRS